MSRTPEDVQSLFEHSLEVIHSALVSYYQLTESEARGAEEDLLLWFQRLARRGGARQMPLKMLRMSLLSAACQYGRSFQLWKLAGDNVADGDLKGHLAREPEDVANDLERRLEEEQS